MSLLTAPAVTETRLCWCDPVSAQSQEEEHLAVRSLASLEMPQAAVLVPGRRKLGCNKMASCAAAMLVQQS